MSLAQRSISKALRPCSLDSAMPDSPRVSVIVPCFNLGQYLDEAVTSVLEQTYQDFEILVVDDGSTDPDTHRALADFDRPRTTVIRTDNQGLAAARNLLIAKARGTYLCPLDADDRLQRTFLETTVACLDQDPTLAFASPRLKTFGEASYLWPPDERCDLTTLLCEHTIITPALVRRDAVIDVGGYDAMMPAQGDEDWDLCISLLEAGYRGVILATVLFDYRQRHGSMGAVCTSGQTHLDLMAYMFRKHRSTYDAHLLDVLLWKDERIAALHVENVQEADRLTDTVEPAVAARRAELEALRTMSPSATAEPVATAQNALTSEMRALRSELEGCRTEVTALRRSISWRLTAPLRNAYSLLFQREGQKT